MDRVLWVEEVRDRSGPGVAGRGTGEVGRDDLGVPGRDEVGVVGREGIGVAGREEEEETCAADCEGAGEPGPEEAVDVGSSSGFLFFFLRAGPRRYVSMVLLSER